MPEPDASSHASAQRVGKGMMYAAWLVALGLLTWSFQGWLTEQDNPNRLVESSVSEDATEVVLQRNRHGHYQATGQINGEQVQFLLDTGATTVAVPVRLAERLGLGRGPAITISTANGTATAYLTRLDDVRLGEITLHDIAATITPSMGGDDVLLGMSFLKQLEFTQRGDSLTLRQAR
jgi:aspartyl protease family protein